MKKITISKKIDSFTKEVEKEYDESKHEKIEISKTIGAEGTEVFIKITNKTDEEKLTF